MRRRAFIRTAAAVLSLPAFESLGPTSTCVAASHPETIRRRLVCVGNSFGMHQPSFFPTEAGRNYRITPLLKPLERHRSSFSVFSNLDHGLKGGHFAVHSFLSGVKLSQAATMPDRNLTLDQRAAEFLGDHTRFRSLTVGSGNGLHGGCQMSWTRSGVRVPPIEGPRELFRKLFLKEARSRQAQVKDSFDLHGSILDAALEDAGRMSKVLNVRDNKKLEEYFSSVRDIEKRIQQQEKWHALTKPDAPIDEPPNENLVDDIPDLLRLIALALETDSTRVASLEIAGANFQTSLLGLKKGYHAYSHHGKDPDNIAGLLKLELYQMQQFGLFLDQLKSTDMGNGKTLLDETTVLFGSGMGNANSHTNSKLPVIVAGGGLKLGEHRVFPTAKTKRVPLCNLFTSLLQHVGVNDDQFGTGTGPIAGLEAQS